MTALFLVLLALCRCAGIAFASSAGATCLAPAAWEGDTAKVTFYLGSSLRNLTTYLLAVRKDGMTKYLVMCEKREDSPTQCDRQMARFDSAKQTLTISVPEIKETGNYSLYVGTERVVSCTLNVQAKTKVDITTDVAVDAPDKDDDDGNSSVVVIVVVVVLICVVAAIFGYLFLCQRNSLSQIRERVLCCIKPQSVTEEPQDPGVSQPLTDGSVTEYQNQARPAPVGQSAESEGVEEGTASPAEAVPNDAHTPDAGTPDTAQGTTEYGDDLEEGFEVVEGILEEERGEDGADGLEPVAHDQESSGVLSRLWRLWDAEVLPGGV